ncbi:hypothetical protein CEXT_494701 [Caerostris extrusa]|uniref:Uncharacterized protein n=1 Tax=Caerostris extrusa TaxID=172846 RepID=A0AAV4NAX6_CAEEX|nr:hypothetical protein CEXT_494701 [Caerostris extrusa]
MTTTNLEVQSLEIEYIDTPAIPVIRQCFPSYAVKDKMLEDFLLPFTLFQFNPWALSFDAFNEFLHGPKELSPPLWPKALQPHCQAKALSHH